MGNKIANGFNNGSNALSQPSEAVVMPQAEPMPPKPKKPDTVTVQVYKGDKLDARKFVKPDTGKPPTP